MKGNLEFTLPEEDEQFKLAIDATNLLLFIRNYERYLRGLVKYNHDFKTIDEALHTCRDKFYEEIDSCDISRWLE